MRYVYTLLFYLALPFIFLRLLWRSRRAPGYRQKWDERLGFCRQQLSNCIWVHAVSVGETIAAIPLIKALKARYPNIPLLVTNMTPTGSARVKAALGDTVVQAFVPYDLPDAVARFLDRTQPLIAIIMETEMWPNLYAVCQARKIPIVITNARLSEQSAQGYRKILPLTRGMLNAVTALASQGHADAKRFIDLGLAAEKITITGNLKFDIEVPADLAAKGAALKAQLGSERSIWIAASTHPTEEEIILAAHRLILEKIPSALLILVPRHPERFDSVAALITEQKFDLARRSRGDVCTAQTQVYLGDTMGEMLLMYSVCDVAFVAGSFASIGGHNMLEPAVLHKPVLTGPQLFNFAEISQMMLQAKGMYVVQDATELAKSVIQFFQNESERHTVGENAYGVVAANRGALQKQIDLIIKNIK